METKTLRKNEVYEAQVTGFTSDGLGVCRVEGCVVFVANAAPGERCQLRISHVGAQKAFGKIERILEVSPQRVNRLCPDAKRCGGCDFWHLTYEAECAIKAQRVTDALNRLGGQRLQTVPITPAVTCLGYRNKAQFPVAAGDGGLVAGFYQKGTHRLIPVERCLIQPECAELARRAVLAYAGRYGVSAYEESSHTGPAAAYLCAVCRRDGTSPGVPGGQREEASPRGCAGGGSPPAVPGLRSVVLNENTRSGNSVLGETMRTLWGEDAIEDVLCGLRFRVSPRSFYQVNRDQAEVLYQRALAAAGLTGTETVLDLYCGTGTITLCLARRARQAIGVELVEAAIQDARENARRNGIENVRFFCADAGQAAQRFSREGVQPDVIVVDPPRKGLSEAVTGAIVQMAPQRVVYVSCDPATLARDVKRLAAEGYRLTHAEAVDLFPRCSHVETVVLLSRKQEKTNEENPVESNSE